MTRHPTPWLNAVLAAGLIVYVAAYGLVWVFR